MVYLMVCNMVLPPISSHFALIGASSKYSGNTHGVSSKGNGSALPGKLSGCTTYSFVGIWCRGNTLEKHSRIQLAEICKRPHKGGQMKNTSRPKIDNTLFRELSYAVEQIYLQPIIDMGGWNPSFSTQFFPIKFFIARCWYYRLFMNIFLNLKKH
jgi:hypothetical protein